MCPINKSGCIAIHAYRFIQDDNIRLPMTIRFVDPEIDHDGIMQLDLRTAEVSKRSAQMHRRYNKPVPEVVYPKPVGPPAPPEPDAKSQA